VPGGSTESGSPGFSVSTGRRSVDMLCGPMSPNRAQPVAWLILMLFSVNAVLSGGGGRLLLCIGCEGLGFGVSSLAVSEFAAWGDECCDDAGTSGSDSRDGVQESSGSRGDCGCVRVPLKGDVPEFRASATSPDTVGPLAMFVSAEPAWPSLLAERGLWRRVHPPSLPCGSAGTLLALRTSLLV
jgi:hypothetical protein